jgi:transposase
MNVAWQLPLWGVMVPGRLATGCSRSCAATTAPAQGQTDVPRQAEFVICDQSIERTFGWLGQSRRLSKDYERLSETSETSEALIYAAMTRIMARRLARH